MAIYSYSEARERLSVLLERALVEGQVKIRSRDGRIFVIRPERQPGTSPFEVRSVKLPMCYFLSKPSNCVFRVRKMGIK